MIAWRSLRVRLPLLVSGLIAIVLTTFLVVAHDRVEATLREAAGERAQAAADQIANMLDGERAAAQLQSLGADPSFRAYLISRSADTREAAMRRMDALRSAGPRRIELWDAAGSRLLEISIPDAPRAGVAPRVLPPGTLPASGGIQPLQTMGGLVYSDTVADIRDDQGMTRGYLLVRSMFSENPPGIFSRLVGGDATVRIGNRDGSVWSDFRRPVPAPAVDLGRPGVAQYQTTAGEMHLGAAAHVRNAPWATWVDFPVAAMVAPARAFRNRMIGVALLFLLIGAVTVGVVSARTTGPLAELSRAAGAMAAGDYSRRVSTNRSDEIGQLARGFNRMADEVEGSQHRLETRVAERTAELTAARQAADRANRAKSEFLSRMSHELRTPLNAIMGFAQVLQLELAAGEQRESVDHILRGGRHLLSLINEVLDVARIEAGALSLSPEPVALADTVQHAVDLIRPLAAQRHLRIDIDPLPNTFALADRQRFNQILFNLLSNAVKYNREHGRIRVFAPPAAPGRVNLVVADTGAGIPAEKLALLFTPFERLGAEQSGIEGTGLGLALAKGLAEAMGGSLTVESVIDSGTSFRLELPLAEGSHLRRDPGAAQADLDSRRGGTILYIEDNISNLTLMDRLVKRRAGVELLHARDGRTGVAMVRERRPDLVFLDLHLPDLPGEDVLRRIWENPETRNIPVVVLSADATPAQKRNLLASGATRYLTKPFDIAEVLAVIDEMLARPRG